MTARVTRGPASTRAGLPRPESGRWTSWSGGLSRSTYEIALDVRADGSPTFAAAFWYPTHGRRCRGGRPQWRVSPTVLRPRPWCASERLRVERDRVLWARLRAARDLRGQPSMPVRRIRQEASGAFRAAPRCIRARCRTRAAAGCNGRRLSPTAGGHSRAHAPQVPHRPEGSRTRAGGPQARPPQRRGPARVLRAHACRESRSPQCLKDA